MAGIRGLAAGITASVAGDTVQGARAEQAWEKQPARMERPARAESVRKERPARREQPARSGLAREELPARAGLTWEGQLAWGRSKMERAHRDGCVCV